MGNNGEGAPKSVIPFAPKLDAKSDELDRAGHAIMDVLRQATGAVEAKYQQAVERTTNYPLSFDPLKTGSRSLKHGCGITRAGQSGPRIGCIKYR